MNLENFKNQVYTTRKARINASERLIKKEHFVQGVNVYYSCILIGLSIYGLDNQSYILSLLNIVASISLTLSLLYINSQKYSERAVSLKKNYIELQKLYFEIEKIDDETQDITKYQDRYVELLHIAENHSELDYLKAQISLGKASFKEQLKCYTTVLFNWIIKIFVIIVPVIVIIIAFVFIYK